MRRLMLCFAVTAALGLAVAAPAVAAPESNPWAFTVTLTCGSDTFEVTTTGKVGFLVDEAPGAAGVTFGGTRTVYVDGQIVSQDTFAPPRGLVGKVEACQAVRVLGSNSVSVWDPVYKLMLPQ